MTLPAPSFGSTTVSFPNRFPTDFQRLFDIGHSALYGLYSSSAGFAPIVPGFFGVKELSDAEIPPIPNHPSQNIGQFDVETALKSIHPSVEPLLNQCDSDGSVSSTHSSYDILKNNINGEKKRKDLVRDQAYWERRRKNNDAAKRSRDSRRRKEDEVAVRAALLEQENLRLRFEVERLRGEIERHRMVAFNPKLVPNPFIPS